METDFEENITEFHEDLTNSSLNATGFQMPSVGMASPILLALTGILGNVVALLVLYTSKQEVKQTAYFVLLVGQAWSDLFSYLLTAPLPIIVYANNLRWVGGQPMCIFSAFVLIGFGMAIPLVVGSLSLERLLALRFPYFYSRTVTVTKARCLFATCWIFILVFCALPFLGLGSYEFQFPGTWCFLNFHNESLKDTVYAYMYSIFNLSVILAIIVCNTTVVWTLLKMKRENRRISPPGNSRPGKSQKSLFQVEMETQMVWFLCAVTLVFICCWVPLNIQVLVNLSTGIVSPKADLLAIRLASVNQVLNPWMYILLRKSVIVKAYAALRKYVCRCKCIQNEEQRNQQATQVTNLYTETIANAQNETSAQGSSVVY